MSDSDAGSVWSTVMNELATAGDRLAAEMTSTRRGVAATDVYATLLGALMDAYLNRYSADTDHPSFIPSTGYHQRLGSPNPDTIYRRAPIDADGVYRLQGTRGTTGDVSLMPFDASMRGGTPLDLDEIAGDDGTVDLLVGSRQPSGSDDRWWHIEADVTSLWLRSTSDRWGLEEEPRLAIARVDRTGGRSRPDADALEARLATLGAAVTRIVEYGIGHVNELVDAGKVNAFAAVDYGNRGAMPGQWYHEGCFEVGDDEALLVEAQMPEGWSYFSWSLTDSMLVTLDWVHAQTSLNRSQAAIDTDGTLRVVISKQDPGVPNWMDTMGHPSGVLQCRTIGSATQPSITARVVPVDSVRQHLPSKAPAVSPAERARALLERTVGFQLRSLW